MTSEAPAPRRNGRFSRAALIGIGGMVAALALLFCLAFGGIVLPAAATDASSLSEALWVLVALGGIPALFGGVLIHSGRRPGTGTVARRPDGWLSDSAAATRCISSQAPSPATRTAGSRSLP